MNKGYLVIGLGASLAIIGVLADHVGLGTNTFMGWKQIILIMIGIGITFGGGYVLKHD